MQQGVDAQNQPVIGPRWRCASASAPVTPPSRTTTGSVRRSSRRPGSARPRTGGQILVTDIVRVLAGSRADHDVASIGADRGQRARRRRSPRARSRWSPVAECVSGDSQLPLPPQVEQVRHVRLRRPRRSAPGAARRLEDRPRRRSPRRLRRRRAGHRQDAAGQGAVPDRPLRSGRLVLWGSCDEELGSPLPAVRRSVPVARGAVAARPARRAASVRSAASSRRSFPSSNGSCPGIGPRLSDDPDTERNRLFEADDRVAHPPVGARAGRARARRRALGPQADAAAAPPPPASRPPISSC